jgi:hypothetical protein
MKHISIIIFIFTISISAIFAGCTTEKKQDDIFAEYYLKLDNIREDKFRELTSYFENVKKKAENITQDTEMKSLFSEKYSLYKTKKGEKYSPSQYDKLFKLRNSIEDRYIQDYLIFYDIMFIHKSGDIFYTVRKQEDYHKNIFQGELAKTKLSDILKNNNSKTQVSHL